MVQTRRSALAFGRNSPASTPTDLVALASSTKVMTNPQKRARTNRKEVPNQDEPVLSINGSSHTLNEQESRLLSSVEADESMAGIVNTSGHQSSLDEGRKTMIELDAMEVEGIRARELKSAAPEVGIDSHNTMDFDEGDLPISKKLKLYEEPLQVKPATVTSKSKAKKTKRALLVPAERPTQSRRGGVWSAEHLLASKKSKLINIDSKLLVNAVTWSMLNSEEQAELIDLLPLIDKVVFDTTNQDASQQASKLFSNLNNEAFRTSFRELQEDLDTGCYENSYIKRATICADERISVHDHIIHDYKDGLFEQYWGQRQRAFNENAGEAARMTLEEMCRAQLVRVGDIFAYDRIAAERHISKNLTLLDISYTIGKKRGACTLTFEMPPGKAKYSQSPTDNSNPTKEDITVTTLSLNDLEKQVLQEHDRGDAPVHYSNGNAWKSFRVHRNNENLNTLHVIRQNYYNTHGSCI